MSDQDTGEQQKRGRKPQITVTDRSAFSVDDVIARRLSGEPFGLKSADIPLREPGKWALRIANSQMNDARHYDMVHRLGYQPATLDDLAEGVTPESVGFRLAEDGKTLCKGVRGDEVLYKMPKDAHTKIQFAKAAANSKSMTSERAAKEDVANAAAAQHGSQAAEYIQKNTTVRVSDRQGPLGAA